jgi:NitT/TauT family transport system permease protein
MASERSLAARTIPAVAGVALLLGAWEWAGARGAFDGAIVSPSAIFDVFSDDIQRQVMITAAKVTTTSALIGYFWGFVAAAICGTAVVVIPPLRRGVDKLATIETAIPPVALAPVMLAIFDRETVPTAMAAVTVFFTLYIACVEGLLAVSKTHLEVFEVFGSSRRQRLLRAQLPAALPVIATGLKVAMPLAIIGAVIGEWFGSTKGVGPVLMVAMRNYRMEQMWAAAAAIVIVALVLFQVMSLVERAATNKYAGLA